MDEIDWAVWGPPIAIVVVGAVVGFAATTRLKSEDEGVTEEGRRIDLETTREEMLEALKVLELDKDKLTAEEYAKEREALLARGAGAMRELDDEAPPAADEADPESPAAQPAAAASAPAPQPAAAAAASGGLAPEWKGALYTLAVVAVVGLLVWFAQDSAVDRREGASMTGNQDLGSGAAAEQPQGPPPMSDAVKARIAELEANVEANAEDLTSLNEITRLYLNHGDPANAMEWNRKALEVDANDLEGRTYKAVLAAMVGMMDQALAQLDAVLAESPGFARALTYKGLILMQLNRAAEAVPVLEKAVELQPDNPILPQALAQAKQMAGMGGAPPMGAGGTFVSGTATLGEGAKVTGNEIVFVSVRDPAKRGPPIAAKKLPAAFPLSFSLGDSDIMAMGGAASPIPATFDMSIRVDTDGNAMTRDAGAPSATLKGVRKGLSGLSVVLTTEGTLVENPDGTASAGAPPPAPAPAAAGGELIVKGTANLDPSATGRVTGDEIVYISVKGPGAGPPLAAFKHQGAKFPVEFELTTAHKIPMAGDRPIPDQVQLSIRVDADGNAFTKEEGAPAVVLDVAKGTSDLSVTLK